MCVHVCALWFVCVHMCMCMCGLCVRMHVCVAGQVTEVTGAHGKGPAAWPQDGDHSETR